MILNESIVEDAPLEWFLLRSAPLNYGGQVGELVPQLREVGHGPEIAPGGSASRDGGRASFSEVVLVGRLREAIRRLSPAIPEEARAVVADFANTQTERRLNP